MPPAFQVVACNLDPGSSCVLVGGNLGTLGLMRFFFCGVLGSVASSNLKVDIHAATIVPGGVGVYQHLPISFQTGSGAVPWLTAAAPVAQYPDAGPPASFKRAWGGISNLIASISVTLVRVSPPTGTGEARLALIGQNPGETVHVTF